MREPGRPPLQIPAQITRRKFARRAARRLGRRRMSSADRFDLGAGSKAGQLRVDHPVVKILHAGEMVVQLALQTSGARQSGQPRRHFARHRSRSSFVCWQRMGLAVLVELQPVFQVPQKLIGRGSREYSAAESRPLSRSREKRQQGAAVPHPGFAPAMQPLQTLHQKLDVADAAARQFHVEAGLSEPAPARS